MAAAFFNAAATSGWKATSAGLHPQESVSAEAVRLVAGTDAEAHFEHSGPRPLDTVAAPDLVVAIDCDVPDAQQWELSNQDGGQAMREELATEELATRAIDLARQMSDSHR